MREVIKYSSCLMFGLSEPFLTIDHEDFKQTFPSNCYFGAVLNNEFDLIHISNCC